MKLRLIRWWQVTDFITDSLNWLVRTDSRTKQVPASHCAYYPPYLLQIVSKMTNITFRMDSMQGLVFCTASNSIIFCHFYNVNVPVICLQCVTRSSSSFRDGLTITLEGWSSFHISFILSNSRQQKYGMIIRKTVLRRHRLGEFINELVKGLSQNDVVTYPYTFLSGYTQILDLP